MLDEQKTTIAKLKQAYGLNAQEAEELLHALYPDSVYPYDIWRQVFIKWGLGWKFPQKNEGKAKNPQLLMCARAGRPLLPA
jgi:hypothetical protein